MTRFCHAYGFISVFHAIYQRLFWPQTDMIAHQLGKNMSTPTTARTLQGITLEAILTELVEQYGWEKLGLMIDIKCFTSDPSIKSSLKFLRKTPWARTKVEELFLSTPSTN
jgi:uncharacterized protein (DUF2132 family)